MIAMAWDNNTQAGALVWQPGGLATDAGLGTAIYISLFTDRRATVDEMPEGDRRGWVGDVLAMDDDRIGSRLWLLKREIASEDVRQRAEDYAAEALAWIVEGNLAAAVEVAAEWLTGDVLGMRITVVAPTLGEVPPFVVPLRVGQA
ncbi:phage GP46 family protein [Humitalea sp. 24SJ18S-53]|uniref:phage GP46 family protein n=1 Tax=Humitalea sp. 24SJ18S-53 TaxID=3422307 RepID=UPI003D679723